MKNSLTTPDAAKTRKFFPRSALVLFGLMSLLLAGSQSARGETCGHYLYRNGQPVGHSVTSSAENAAAAAAASVRHTEQFPLLPQTPRLPCNGPGCQKQSAPLMPAPSAPLTSVERDPAAILNALLSAPGCSCTVCAPQSESGEVRLPSQIFRPPAG